MEKRNHWTGYPDKILLWTARAPVRVDAPEALIEWTKRIVVLAEEHGIAEFRPSREAAWWSRDEVFAHIDRCFAERQAVDAFEFASGFMRTRSKLAFHDQTGIAEQWIDDVGALLDTLRGPVADEYRHTVDPCPPIWVSGHQIEFASEATSMRASEIPTTGVTFAISSDIWLPWVRGTLDPETDELYDNRELATRHTTRFNRFLDEIRRLSIDCGGDWQFFSFSQAPSRLAMAGPDGIRLLDTPVLRDRYRPRSGES